MKQHKFFNLLIIASLLVVATALAPVQTARAGGGGAPAYVRSQAGGAPWGETTNEAAMDTVFGAGNWDDLRYETVDPAVLFSVYRTFVFMEGGDDDANDMEAFLTANQTDIEAWVSNGGRLFINAAPNEGNGMSYGFGGVKLIYPGFPGNEGNAVDSGHSIFNGPYTPIASNFTGGSFSHAYITGGSWVPVIVNENLHPSLAETSWGDGCVLFGGMTTDNFHSPQPEAANLRANILDYLNYTFACVTPNQLLTNGSFEIDANGNKWPDDWGQVSLDRTIDKLDSLFHSDGMYSMKMAGKSHVQKMVTQSIYITGDSPDYFYFSVDSRASKVPSNAIYRAQVILYNGATQIGIETFNFEKGTHGFQTGGLLINAPGPYTRITVRLIYNATSGQVWFDSASLLQIVAPIPD
jgi:hypothetical protein